MKECVIVGYPNSGKTLFALNFASFLGSKSVDITARSYDGLLTCRHLSIADAKNELCSMALHKTRLLQSMVLKMPIGKATVMFKLTDTCGISEQIHSDQTIRCAMAQTLGLVRCADFILHIIDLSRMRKNEVQDQQIDQEIYQYGIARQNYIMLANKTDLPMVKENITRLSAEFPHAQVIPISALYSDGFKEVKAYVARNI
ncbi:GTPase [Anaerospora hongkongensis]|uniref:GTPase n=1 Tax=Anaerospora hongkongensis TaxID=244830 RepID=UPI00289F782B|nr:GTPase [Anaerospora hongkongensis]